MNGKTKKELVEELKTLIIRTCNLDSLGITAQDINPDDPMVGPQSPLELDSLDITELVVAIEKAYDIRIGSMNLSKEIFQSINTLADFVLQKINAPVKEVKVD